MTYLIAGGSYYRDEVLQGYGTGALIASVFLIPLLLLLYKKRVFRIAATLCVSAAFPLAVYLAPRSICPHYWEIILPLFLSTAVAVLAITRFCIDRRFGLTLAWYILVTMALAVAIPSRSAPDLYGVLTKTLRTRLESERNQRQILEENAARLRLAPKGSYVFDKARLGDVMRVLAAEAGIPLISELGEVDAEVLVSFSGELSPFSALEEIAKKHDIELLVLDGDWVAIRRPG